MVDTYAHAVDERRLDEIDLAFRGRTAAGLQTYLRGARLRGDGGAPVQGSRWSASEGNAG
jgi:hypothetical protein